MLRVRPPSTFIPELLSTSEPGQDAVCGVKLHDPNLKDTHLPTPIKAIRFPSKAHTVGQSVSHGDDKGAIIGIRGPKCVLFNVKPENAPLNLENWPL